MTDVSYAPDRSPSRHHLHRWEARLDDDRWYCACGASARELENVAGETIRLPKDRVSA